MFNVIISGEIWLLNNDYKSTKILSLESIEYNVSKMLICGSFLELTDYINEPLSEVCFVTVSKTLITTVKSAYKEHAY